MATVLSQACTVFLDSAGVQKFKIISTIESFEADDLPSASIFVHQIVAVNDPKSDVFLRVANVVDLTTLKRSRQLAVDAGETIYVDTTFTVIYDNVATASQAKLLIQQRVDNCIADWHSYTEQFVNPINYPTGTPTVTGVEFPMTTTLEDQLKAEYAAAHAEYLTSKTAVATATAGLTAATTAAASANEAVASAVTESQQCSTMLGQFNSGKRAVDTYRTVMNDFVTTRATDFTEAAATFKAACDLYASYGTSPTSGQLSTFQTAISTFNSAKTTFDSYQAPAATAVSTEATQGQAVLDNLSTDMAATCTTKRAYVQIATTNKTEADTALGAAATEKKAADAAAAAALAEDTRTYLAVKEICPDFERITP